MGTFSELCNNVVDFGEKKSNARKGKICKLTPHHMAWDMLAGDCAKSHRDSTREASANYYIGSDGFIVGGVSEDRRAWTSSSEWNDQQAITIEVANCSGAPDWKISDEAYKSLISLCADICKRYGITPHYDKTINGSITYHSMFSATLCPGPYLKGLIDSGKFEQDIKNAMQIEQAKPNVSDVLYRVQTGAFKNKANAEKLSIDLKNKGFADNYICIVGGLYKVQVGAFANEDNAKAMAKKLVTAGFEAFITTSAGTAIATEAYRKSTAEIAKEVVAGKWGNGEKRRKALISAGYSYPEVQRAVNALLKK